MVELEAAEQDADARWSALQGKIEAQRDVFARQGSLVRKRRRGHLYWYLRYYDYEATGRRQRSLPVILRAETRVRIATADWSLDSTLVG